jgi:hypothetical protein
MWAVFVHVVSLRNRTPRLEWWNIEGGASTIPLANLA